MLNALLNKIFLVQYFNVQCLNDEKSIDHEGKTIRWENKYIYERFLFICNTNSSIVQETVLKTVNKPVLYSESWQYKKADHTGGGGVWGGREEEQMVEGCSCHFKSIPIYICWWKWGFFFRWKCLFFPLFSWTPLALIAVSEMLEKRFVCTSFYLII